MATFAVSLVAMFSTRWSAQSAGRSSFAAERSAQAAESSSQTARAALEFQRELNAVSFYIGTSVGYSVVRDESGKLVTSDPVLTIQIVNTGRNVSITSISFLLELKSEKDKPAEEQSQLTLNVPGVEEGEKWLERGESLTYEVTGKQLRDIPEDTRKQIIALVISPAGSKKEVTHRLDDIKPFLADPSIETVNKINLGGNRWRMRIRDN